MMRFDVRYHGNHDFYASTYDDAHAEILRRHVRRMRACGFALNLSNYEVIDNHEPD